MSTTIKVLLVDDKEDYCKSLSGVARHRNLQVIYQLDWETGFEVLQSDPTIEFVILDGKGKIEADQETEKDNFVNKAMKDIEAYSRDVDRHIPYCVNTGFLDRFESLESIVEIFEKNEVDREKMFEYIIERTTNSEFFYLKSKYPNAISFCTDAYLGYKHLERVLGLIKDIENINNIKVAQDMLNPMRKIMEALFYKLNQIGIIPDEIIQGQGSINGSSYFLTGKNLAYAYNEILIHPMVAESIYRLTTLTQDASHNTGNKLTADDYFAKSKTNHLYVSSIYLLLDILDWMKNFIDNHPDKEANLAKWTKKEDNPNTVSYEGQINQDEANNYYCGKHLLNYSYVHGKFQIGQKINILQEDINSNPRTKHLYSHYAVKFEIID